MGSRWSRKQGKQGERHVRHQRPKNAAERLPDRPWNFINISLEQKNSPIFHFPHYTTQTCFMTIGFETLALAVEHILLPGAALPATLDLDCAPQNHVKIALQL